MLFGALLMEMSLSGRWLGCASGVSESVDNEHFFRTRSISPLPVRWSRIFVKLLGFCHAGFIFAHAVVFVPFFSSPYVLLPLLSALSRVLPL